MQQPFWMWEPLRASVRVRVTQISLTDQTARLAGLRSHGEEEPMRNDLVRGRCHISQGSVGILGIGRGVHQPCSSK